MWCFGSDCGHDKSSLLLHLHHHPEKSWFFSSGIVFNVFWKFTITRCHVEGCAGWLRHEPRSAAALALQGRSKSLDAPSPGGLDVVTRWPGEGTNLKGLREFKKVTRSQILEIWEMFFGVIAVTLQANMASNCPRYKHEFPEDARGNRVGEVELHVHTHNRGAIRLWLCHKSFWSRHCCCNLVCFDFMSFIFFNFKAPNGIRLETRAIFCLPIAHCFSLLHATGPPYRSNIPVRQSSTRYQRCGFEILREERGFYDGLDLQSGDAYAMRCVLGAEEQWSAKVEFLTNFERQFIIIYRCFRTPTTPPNKWRFRVSLISVSSRRHVQCPRHWFRSKKGCVPLWSRRAIWIWNYKTGLSRFVLQKTFLIDSCCCEYCRHSEPSLQCTLPL